MRAVRSSFATLYRHEMRLVLRDRRALALAILLPLVLVPLVLWTGVRGQEARQERLDTAVYRVAVQGPLDRWIVELLGSAGAGDDGGSTDDLDTGDLDFVDMDDGPAALAEGTVDLVIRTRDATRLDLADSPVADVAAVRGLVLLHRGDRDVSIRALGRVQERLEGARQSARESLVRDAGAADLLDSLEPTVERVGVAPPGGGSLGRWIALVLLLAVLAGGAMVAADTLAGDAERGVLETWLTSAVDRRQLVAAKLWAIASLGVGVGGLHLVNLLWLASVFGVAPPSDGTPWWALGVLVPLLAPLVLLVSGALLWLSGWARSYQRFQMGFFPLVLVLVALAAAPFLPTASLDSVLVAVPVANLALAAREVLAGDAPWGWILMAWAVSGGWVAVLFRQTVRVLDGDRALALRADTPSIHRDALAAERVLPWFVGLWAVNLLAGANLAFLANLHAQLAFNLLVVVLGGSLLFVRLQGLDPRQALHLDGAPPPRVWPLVCVLIPVAVGTSLLLGRLSEVAWPVAEPLRQAWVEFLALESLSALELVALVAVLPAICEELAFRGLLLWGLRRRMAPLSACVLSGLVFAIFHMDPVRLVPTLALGFGLALITLWSGSVLPAIVVHGAHNGLIVLAAHRGVDLGTVPAWLCLVCAVVWSGMLWGLWSKDGGRRWTP